MKHTTVSLVKNEKREHKVNTAPDRASELTGHKTGYTLQHSI